MYDKSWGSKRSCLHCLTNYYDFNKANIACPKCGEPFVQELIFKKKSKVKEFDDLGINLLDTDSTDNDIEEDDKITDDDIQI